MESRPTFLSDMVLTKPISSLFNSMLRTNTICSLLLHGSPGVGKTSAIECLCNEFEKKLPAFSKSRDVLVLNASDDRGLDTVRIVIKAFVEHSGDHPRIVVLDEIDAMTGTAQRVLANIIAEHNCYLFATCNYLCHVDASLRDLCILIQMPCPNREDSIKILMRNTGVSEELAAGQYDQTNGDLRTAKNYCTMLKYLDSDTNFLTAEEKTNIRGIEMCKQYHHQLRNNTSLANELLNLVLQRRIPATIRLNAIDELKTYLQTIKNTN